MESGRRGRPDIPLLNTATDGACYLAARVLLNAFKAAIKGDDEAELWLREDSRCKKFCYGLNISHQEVIAILERRQREQQKTKRKRKTKRGKK